VEDLERIFREETGEAIAPESSSDVRETITRALDLLAEEEYEACGGVVVICGTGYIMPEARSYFGVIEPR
jgi:hypothetical protein